MLNITIVFNSKKLKYEAYQAGKLLLWDKSKSKLIEKIKKFKNKSDKETRENLYFY